MNKKILIFVSFFLILIGLFSQQAAFAQEENSSPTPEPTTTSNLKEVVNKIVEQRKNKVDQVLNELTNQKKGFVGQVLRVSETTFSLDVYGTTKIVAFDENVKLVKNNQEIKPENVAVDNWATVMGIVEDDEITPKRIEFSEKSPLPKPQLVELGSVKKITAKSIEFQSRSGESTQTIIINNQTNIEDLDGEEASIKDFAEEDQILVVGYTDEDANYATTIRALAPFVKE